MKGIFVTGTVTGEPVIREDQCTFELSAADGTSYRAKAEGFADASHFLKKGKKLTVMGKCDENFPNSITVSSFHFSN